MNLFNGDEDLQRRYADALKTSVDKTFGVEMNNERSLAKEITEGFEALKSMRNNEPVAWIDKDGNIFYTNGIAHTLPLYTHPVKELTDEEIDSVVHELRQKSFDPKRWLDVYTVAIETIIQLRDELRKAQENG
jgi:hypothetical protein